MLECSIVTGISASPKLPKSQFYVAVYTVDSLLDVEVVAHEESRLLGGYRALAPRTQRRLREQVRHLQARARAALQWTRADPPASPHARHAPRRPLA